MPRRLALPCLLCALLWCPFPVLGHDAARVEVVGHHDNTPGTSDSASQGLVGPEMLRTRTLQRPGELLELIAGMVVTQHSGDGKANQYFLRGMSLDHGTDFATTVNGVPLNMPTHAHGQGYTDLNVLIPELVARVAYRKGPYFAADGDFSSVGSANIVYRQRLDEPIAQITLGQRGHVRSLVAGSRTSEEGVTLLLAVEGLQNNGPWTVPERMRKTNALLTLSGGTAAQGWSTSLSAHEAQWNSTDQVPLRLIRAGVHQGRPFGRFDSLDPSNGGDTRRLSLSGSWHRSSDHATTRAQWFALGYDLNLFSNFTYSLARASDQFVQTDRRTVLGGRLQRSWFGELGGGKTVQNTLGVQLRQDRIRVGLLDSQARQILGTVRDDLVSQSLVGVHGESAIGWNRWLRTVAGWRFDRFDARVTSLVQDENTGVATASLLSPKLSVILGPWHRTEFFLNAGRGFHSNDARGATARRDPRTGSPIEPAPALAASRGHEAGLRSHIAEGWQTTLAFWQLEFDSELVYAGDAGNTEAGRPSRRNGIEWTNHWTPNGHFWVDANFAWSRPRYSDHDPAGNAIANAVRKVAHLNFSLRRLGPWTGSLGIRYIGGAPLIEDGTVQSSPSLTAHLRMARKVSRDLDVALDVLNLTDRRNNDIAYFYTSRLAGEPAAGVADVHLHPAEPRTVRLTARVRF